MAEDGSLLQVPAGTAQETAPSSTLSNRGVYVFCGLAILNHFALTGGRVTVALGSLSQGASSFTVGVLMALFALLPMLLSVHTGRWVDRIGVRRPMRVGTLLLIFGSMLPFAISRTEVLFLSSCTVGIGCMLYIIAAQNLMGANMPPERRIVNFARLSISMSISGFSGPLVAGLAIDHLGYRWSFGILTLAPLAALVALIHYRRLLPRTLNLVARQENAQLSDLLAMPVMRKILIATLLLSGAWDVNAFMMPIFGNSIGLSATTIGVILATFAAATFVVRMMLPWIQRALTPWQLLRTAMLSAGSVYLLFPMFTQVPVLIGLAFLLGLALGSCQPSLLGLLHTHAPLGRAAEALGLRMALINGGQFTLPLTCGALGAVAGVGLPFWTMATGLLLGGIFNGPPRTPPCSIKVPPHD
ncbi:MFS transporter [Pigmentiphaga litoralis]|nr:MFS transporter [Pigmentiphaga litoralis]